VWNPEQAMSALRLEKTCRVSPTWIGVGAADRFHREDVEYGERLKAAGVCTHVLGSLVAGEAGSGHEPGPHRDGGAMGRPRVYPEGG
jgi:acetyl esterase/lipase